MDRYLICDPEISTWDSLAQLWSIIQSLIWLPQTVRFITNPVWSWVRDQALSHITDFMHSAPNTTVSKFCLLIGAFGHPSQANRWSQPSHFLLFLSYYSIDQVDPVISKPFTTCISVLEASRNRCDWCARFPSIDKSPFFHVTCPSRCSYSSELCSESPNEELSRVIRCSHCIYQSPVPADNQWLKSNPKLRS